MSVDSALTAGRAAAEARMTSRVAIRRKTGGMTTAPNGRQVPAWTTVYEDLPARLVGTPSGTTPARHRSRNLGGAEVSLASRGVVLPPRASDLRDGDHVDFTAGENAGVVLILNEVTWQDQATARRIPAVETQRPQEWS